MNRQCISCEAFIFTDDEKCSLCAAGSVERHSDLVRCVVCGEDIRAGARLCKSCKTYQSWFGRHFAVVTTIAAIVTAAVTIVSAGSSAWVFVSSFRSDTRVSFVRATDSRVYVRAWNTGGRASALTGYRLRFDAMPDKEIPLILSQDEIGKSDNVITNGPAALVALDVPVFEELPRRIRNRLPTPPEIEHLPQWDSVQPMTLIVDVQESSDDPGERHRREEHLSSMQVRYFIAKNWGLSLRHE